MIHFRRESLLPSRVSRRRIGAADVPPQHMSVVPKRLESPPNVIEIKPSAFPICAGVIRRQTIQIDRNVNVRADQFVREFFKLFPPIVAQNRAASFLRAQRPIVRPRMDRQRPSAFRFTIAKNLPRPPALKISTSPNCRLSNVRQFQRAIDPATATPAWGANIPVRMIIKRNQCNRFGGSSKPQSGQMMKVARTVKNESAEMGLNFAIKLFDGPGRSRETKVRSPFCRINPRQIVCDLAPGIVEIEMNFACDHHGGAN